MAPKIVPVILFGLGHVNRGWLEIWKAHAPHIAADPGIRFKIVAVADSSGVAVSNDGYDADELIKLKKDKGSVRTLNGFLPGVPSSEIVNHVQASVMIESSPGNLIDGQPGLNAARLALQKGMHVVFANKAPLIFAYDELHSLSSSNRRQIRFSATVCGGLPVVNVIQRDLRLARILSVRGIFNATTNFILRELEKGGDMDAAVKEAQRIGAAEADPSHDIDGHDSANKLFIVMKAAGLFKGSIHDIHVSGIRDVCAEQLSNARQAGKKIKLIAEATPDAQGGWHLSVLPREVDTTSFLGTCDGWEMGIEIASDLYEKVYLKNYEAEPTGTSAAVMRDVLDIEGGGNNY